VQKNVTFILNTKSAPRDFCSIYTGGAKTPLLNIGVRRRSKGYGWSAIITLLSYWN